MTEVASDSPVATGNAAPLRAPIETLRREIDRAFDSFGISYGRLPSFRSTSELDPLGSPASESVLNPAVDLAEKRRSYELTVELPGVNEHDVEVKLVNSTLVI